MRIRLIEFGIFETGESELSYPQVYVSWGDQNQIIAVSLNNSRGHGGRVCVCHFSRFLIVSAS